MTSAMSSPASNFSRVPIEPHLPSPLSLLSSFSRLPLERSGSCSGNALDWVVETLGSGFSFLPGILVMSRKPCFCAVHACPPLRQTDSLRVHTGTSDRDLTLPRHRL